MTVTTIAPKPCDLAHQSKIDKLIDQLPCRDVYTSKSLFNHSFGDERLSNR